MSQVGDLRSRHRRGTNTPDLAATDCFASETPPLLLSKRGFGPDGLLCSGRLTRQPAERLRLPVLSTCPGVCTVFSAVNRIPAASGIVPRHRDAGDPPRRLGSWMTHRISFEMPRARGFRCHHRSASGGGSVGDHAPGCAFLSGGTDRIPTVAGMLLRCPGETREEPIPSASRPKATTKWSAARLAARHFGCNRHEYYTSLPRIIPWRASGRHRPLSRPAIRQLEPLSALVLLRRMARNDGCTRILAGDGVTSCSGGNSPLRHSVTRLSYPVGSRTVARSRPSALRR